MIEGGGGIASTFFVSKVYSLLQRENSKTPTQDKHKSRAKAKVSSADMYISIIPLSYKMHRLTILQH